VYFPVNASGFEIPNQIAIVPVHCTQPSVPTPEKNEIIVHKRWVKHWSAGLETPQLATGFHIHGVKSACLAPKINDAISDCRLSRTSVHAKGHDLFCFGVTDILGSAAAN
jgi:hypothetical protein